MLLYSNNRLIVAEDNVRTYNIGDRVSGCSTWLSTIIFLFCNNTYKIVKRDTTSVMIDKMAPKEFQLKTTKRLIMESARRVRRQVADECCTRACTVADIIMYCPDDAKLVQERPDIFDLL